MKMRAILDKAYDRTLNLISHRPRSEWELSNYLRRKDYDQQTSEAVIEKLRAHGYVNDEDFARRWVESRRLLKATSKRRLTQELRQKRIDSEIIEQVLRADETDEREVLRELIERKSTQTRYQDEKRLIAYLMRQGFQYGDIKTALTDKYTK